MGELDDRYPMLLLPVRIETRFQITSDRNELRVRIFPDEVAIVAHRRELTEVELDDGKAYWIERAKARAEPDPAAGRQSWRAPPSPCSPRAMARTARAGWRARRGR